MKIIAAHIAKTKSDIARATTDQASAEDRARTVIAHRDSVQQDLEFMRLQLKEHPMVPHGEVDAAIGAGERLLLALDEQLRLEEAKRHSVAAVIDAGMQSVEASEEALMTLSRRLNQTPRGALRSIDLAAWIAGGSYPWAAEAWLADISVAADGGGELVRPSRQFLSALAIVCWTAPRMRTRTLWWNLTCAVARLGRWCLYYDPATATVIGASHVALVEFLREDVGFYSSVALATIVALAAVEIIRRVRRTASGKVDRS